MRRAAQLAVLVLTLCTVALSAPVASAQSGAPRMETGVSSQNIEVGRPFSLQLSAMVDASDRVPEKPQLQTPSGIVVRAGPSVMPKTQVTLNGPNLIQQLGVVVTWTLEATRPGKYRIGPPSVLWAGKRHTGSQVLVQAHPRGSRPRPKPRDPFDMFDIFGLPKLPGLFDRPSDRFNDPLLPPTEPSLAMTAAPAREIFLRAMVDKTTVVLGEQVTLSIHEYRQHSAIRRIEVREPSAPDFLQRPMLDPSEDPGTRYAEVGSSVWTVRLFRKIALFPLRTGDLTIEPMHVTYSGRGLRSKAVRQSRPVTVRVIEAPPKGRPVGYRPGDVGRFSLNATTEPRTVEAGGAIAVRVTLQGAGNFPNTLPTPSGKGIEWLDPEVHDDIEAVNGELRGKRVFNYVVRLGTAGNVDLGRIELPFYDPDRRRYEVARARLGEVTVRPNPDAPPEAQKKDRFSDLAGPRATLGKVPPRSGYITDSPWYWLALLASPLSVALFGVGLSFARRLRRSVGSWRESLDRQAKVSLAQAKRAMTHDKASEAATAIERAIHATVESSTGLKSRGILREALHDALTDAGVDEASAEATVKLLASLESLRFDPAADQARVEVLLDEARSLIRTLNKTRKSPK